MITQQRAQNRRQKKPVSQRERSAATQEQLIQAVVRSLIEHGYHRTSVSEICRRAGVTSSAIQHHFGGKRQLMMAVAETLDVRNRELLDRVASSPKPLEVLAQMEANPDLWLEGLRVNHELLMAARSDPELWDLYAPFQRAIFEWRDAWAVKVFGDAPVSEQRRVLMIRLLDALATGVVSQVMVTDDHDYLRGFFTFLRETIQREIEGTEAP
jgi:AcrR family transcriptional regulator